MRALIFLSLILSGANCFAEASKLDMAMGFGMESRMQRDVNPEYNTQQNSGQLYAKLRFWPWALEIETGRSELDSGQGSLRIRSESTLLGLWGRYEFKDPGTFAPFASLGVGSYFDVVDTTFESSHDRRTGLRKFMGAGGGVSTVFWTHLQVELEGRVMTLEETKDPIFSGLIRIGCQI